MDKSSCATPVSKIRVGVSACLLGAKVRFDGGHKRNRYVDEVLRDYFEFVPLCPEVAVGLGTPRQPIRLLGTADYSEESLALFDRLAEEFRRRGDDLE